MKAAWRQLVFVPILFGGISWAAAQGGEELPQLRPIRTEIPPTYWEREGKALTLHLTEVVAWLGFAAWLLSRPQPKAEEPIEVVTRRELEQLRTQADASAGLSGVARVLRRYFIAAFNLPPGEHTTEEFCRLLAGTEAVGCALAERTTTFLRRCDATRFAAASGHVHGVIAEAFALIASGESRRQELRDAARTPTTSSPT
jgi:hypothetical protein